MHQAKCHSKAQGPRVFQNTIRGVLDQDRDDDLLGLMIYHHTTHTQMGLFIQSHTVPFRTFPVAFLCPKPHVFCSPVREATESIPPSPWKTSLRGTLDCKVPRKSAGLGSPKRRYCSPGVLYPVLAQFCVRVCMATTLVQPTRKDQIKKCSVCPPSPPTQTHPLSLSLEKASQPGNSGHKEV